jgi:hypothetical protein
MIGMKEPIRLDRWFSEPRHVVITVAGILVFGVMIAFAARLVTGPTLDAEALRKLRSGVVIVKTNDPNVCKELKFSNETGTFGAPLPTSCDHSSNAREAPDQTRQHSEGQLGSIRDSFRGR